jgi:CheY-like chemotaxis protein
MAKRALILDDDRTKANLVSIWLEKSCVEADKVYTYDEALKRINFKYDFLILDYFLTVGQTGQTGSDFAALYQKKHPGCQIYVYSAIPEDIKDCTAIDFNDLETFIQDKIMFANPSPNKGTDKVFDIFIIKQKLDDEISDLKAAVARHDEKITGQEKTQEDFKKDMEKLSTSVSGFITEHNNDAKKIIYWIAGILITIFLAFIGIEWAIIEHLMRQFIK